MKKLDLNVERYIVEEKIFPEDEKSVTYIYPEVLKDNLIFRENIFNHTIEMFQKLFKDLKELSFCENQLNECIFSIQEKLCKDRKEGLAYKIERQKALISEDLDPFYWDIYKDADMYSHEIDHYVKDDYVLILKYKKEEPDE